MDCWLTIEVSDGAFAASSWRDAHEDGIIEAAVTHGGLEWNWHTTQWGVVLEIRFGDVEARDRFRGLPAIRAALDGSPDPIGGLYIYPGRGGGAGAVMPRLPRPAPQAGAAEVEIPVEPLSHEWPLDDLDPRPDWVRLAIASHRAVRLTDLS